MLSFQEAIKTCFRQYAQFRGRAPRSEYWWWALFVFLVMLASQIIDGLVIAPLLGLPVASTADGTPLSSILGLALLIPNISVAVRRLHDVNRSGFWLFIILVPILGFLLLLYWYLQPSYPGQTKYDS